MKTIVPITTPTVPSLEQVGGKALGLITMARLGMPVPPGFVLTVEFFAPWIAVLQAIPEWESLHSANENELGSLAVTLQAHCGNLRLTPEQRQALDGALSFSHTDSAAALFAVRSSCPEEDLHAASFAGGYETILGATAGGIEEAIGRCFASVLGSRVLLYRRERGLSIGEPRMAVIVQQQIDADRAGVAFSLNPVNNCFDEAVISANFGLGESVVAGLVDPDVFVFERPGRKVIDTRTGRKELVIRLDHGGGTVTSPRSADQEQCLTQDQVARVAALVGQVEACFREPVDIEWAIANQELYLLQARPITTYLPLPDEMLTTPGSPKNLYADATLIEQGVQEPLSVLGTDFLRYVLRQMTGPLGGDAPGIDGIAFTAGGRYYMHLSHAIKMLGPRAPLAPGSYGDAGVKAILDSIDLEQYLPRRLPRNLRAAKRRLLFSMLLPLRSILAAYRRPEAFMQRYREDLPRHLQRFEMVTTQGRALRDVATDLSALLGFFFIAYGLPITLAAQLAQRRIRNMFQKEGAQVKEQIASLGMALPGNKTVEMGEWLGQLASSPEIRQTPSPEKFLACLERRSLEPTFLKSWQGFVKEFGARCPREIDVATPRPNERPGLLFEQVARLSPTVAGGTGPEGLVRMARAKREAAYASLRELALRKGRGKAKTLDNCYRVWLTLGGYRETPKHHVIGVIDRFRKSALQVAEGLVAEGRLDEPEQVFSLTIADIDQALGNAAIDLRALGRERSAFTDRLRRCHNLPPVIDSRGRAFYPPRPADGAGALHGVAVSPGVARGRVRVLHTADEARLLPGEILVARVTDPGWTPQFINAGGIVLEIGGPLQHGAVVAREYGIPCVSGLEGATERLSDGQLVEVDGSNGVVRIVEENGSEPEA